MLVRRAHVTRLRVWGGREPNRTELTCRSICELDVRTGCLERCDTVRVPGSRGEHADVRGRDDLCQNRRCLLRLRRPVLGSERKADLFRRQMRRALRPEALSLASTPARECHQRFFAADRPTDIYAASAISFRRLFDVSGFSISGFGIPTRKPRMRSFSTPPVMKTIRGSTSGALVLSAS
jgi:hypothetical protein